MRFGAAKRPPGHARNVDVAAEASPRLEHNTIHASRKCGVCFAAGALGWLLENDVFRNGYANVGVLEGTRACLAGGGGTPLSWLGPPRGGCFLGWHREAAAHHTTAQPPGRC